MNLLLYAESKYTLARANGEPVTTHAARLALHDLAPILPDSLFEELGYFGALDEDDTETDTGEESVEDFLRWMSEPLLSF